MKNILTVLMMTTVLTSPAIAGEWDHYDKTHNTSKKATSWFGELANEWETHGSSGWGITKHKYINQATDAQDYTLAPGQTWTGGWCNEAIVWAMEETGTFQDNIRINPWGYDTMRGRHFTDHYNTNVTQTWNHDESFDWDDVQVGAVVGIDFQSNPKDWGNLGIDHTTTYMGRIEGTNYGWFLGGNQSGRLQPKMYELQDATFISMFQDDGVSDHTYHYDIKHMTKIDLPNTSDVNMHVSWKPGYGHYNEISQAFQDGTLVEGDIVRIRSANSEEGEAGYWANYSRVNADGTLSGVSKADVDPGWTEVSFDGWGYGKHKQPKSDGAATSWWMSNQWKQHGDMHKKFTSRDKSVTARTTYDMKTYMSRNDNKRYLIRANDHAEMIQWDAEVAAGMWDAEGYDESFEGKNTWSEVIANYHNPDFSHLKLAPRNEVFIKHVQRMVNQ